MNKLLYANLARLKHDTVFWIGTLVMAAVGLLLPLYHFYLMWKYPGYMTNLDDSFFTHVPLIVIIAAAFCSLFIGTEYSDGTIRNKMIVGHRRIDIYLSNLIICFVAECMMCLAYYITNLGIGIPLLGFFVGGLNRTLGYVGCIFMLCAAVTAIYTLIAMLSQNKAVSAVISIIGIVFMIFFGAYLGSMLDAPEVYEGYVYWDKDTGEYIEEEEVPNPYYISGSRRVVYEFFNDLMPGSQTAQLWLGNAVHLGRMALYSGVIAIVVTGFGVFFFCGEDIK